VQFVNTWNLTCKGEPAGGLTPSFVLVALYMVVALTVPNTFIIAGQASDELAGQFLQQVEHSSARLVGSASDDADTPLSEPNCPSGVLESKEGGDAASGLCTASEGRVLGTETEASTRKPGLHKPGAKKDKVLPQELLRRPPPSGS
jgi:hypothetical protein